MTKNGFVMKWDITSAPHVHKVTFHNVHHEIQAVLYIPTVIASQHCGHSEGEVKDENV